MRYPATVGEDLRIKINTAKPLTVGRTGVASVTVESLGSILRGDSDGAEVLNGRAAMIGFLLSAGVEASTGKNSSPTPPYCFRVKRYLVVYVSAGLEGPTGEVPDGDGSPDCVGG